MALTIQTQEDDQRQLSMTVEVAEERVDKAMRKAARKLAREVHVPGFRRGKAPYQVIVRRVGRDALRADIAEELVQPVLEEALEDVGVDIYGVPSLEEMELEPLTFKFTIPLVPQIELGDYREIRKDIEPVSVSEEAVQEALEQVQIQHQVIEEVDRPAEEGDVVTISGKGELVTTGKGETTEETGDEEEEADNETSTVLFDEEQRDLLLDEEKLFKGTPFVDNLIGLSAGDEKTFSFVFPEDYEDEELAGKEANISITVLNVKRRDLPEIDDELARQEGDYETIDELRVGLRKKLEEQAQSVAKNELIESMLDDLMEKAQLVYPPSAVEEEIDQMVQSFKNQVTQSGWEWEDYLKLQAKTEEQVREDYREAATRNLERRLLLRQFIIAEQLTAEEEDVDYAIEKRLIGFGDNEKLKNDMADYYRSGYGFEMIRSEVLMDKVYERISLILSGDAPELEVADRAAGDEEE